MADKKPKAEGARDYRLVFKDVLGLLKLARFRLGKRVEQNQYVECPFHSGDKTPSLSVHSETGAWRCFGCGKTGSFEALLAQKAVGSIDKAAVEGVKRIYAQYLEEIDTKTVDPRRAEVYHRRLLEDDGAIAALYQRKGINRESIAKFTIGWNGERYTLPVYDQHGNIVNIRYRTLDPNEVQKCKNLQGHGAPRLYPIQDLAEATLVLITEGELKALLLRQMGFTVFTGTSGANKWVDEWSPLFKDKHVITVFDIDAGGIAGSRTVARSLLKYAKSIKRAIPPLDKDKHPKGGVDDWILLEGATKDDIDRMLAAAQPYEFRTATVETTTTLLDIPLEEVEILAAVQKPEMQGKHIVVDAVVSGEDTEPFMAPIEWKVACQEDQSFCNDCPVKQLGKRDFGLSPWCSPDVLKLVDVPEGWQKTEMKRWTGIPRLCSEHEIRPTKFARVEMVELAPDVDSEKQRGHDVTVPCFFVQKDVASEPQERNSLHSIKGFPTVDPKSGRLVLLAYDAEPASESIDRFQLDDETTTLLTQFRPAEWTAEALEAHLDAIADDLAARVTGIHGRRILHRLIDAVYHSPLRFTYERKSHRGWLDVMVLGDAGQGKSGAVEALRSFYGRGDFAVGASCTAAGLLGSVQESIRKRRWVYRWGKIPLNDRRLVIIEEASGLPYETIQRLRDARSSGRHEETKAKIARVRTRTRLLWLSNTRGSRPLREHAYGIEALKHLIGDEPDMRRFDAVLFISEDDVSIDTIQAGAQNHPLTFEDEAYRTLILWAWALRQDQVVFDDDVPAELKRLAAEQAAKYSSRIPLVLATEHDSKLGRIAAALAARTFSADGDGRVVVRLCHAQVAAKMLDEMYSASACAYDGYSKKVRSEETLVDAEAVRIAFLKKFNHDVLLPARTTVQWLLEVPAFSARDLYHVCAMEFTAVERFVGMLLRNNAVRPGGQRLAGMYVKTPGFTAVLKGLQADKDLRDRTGEEAFKEERF